MVIIAAAHLHLHVYVMTIIIVLMAIIVPACLYIQLLPPKISNTSLYIHVNYTYTRVIIRYVYTLCATSIYTSYT